MKKITINHVNEDIYFETLDNGLKVYLYVNKNMHNNYVTFTTKYGAVYNEFVPIGKNKMKSFPKGIAHFLEHKVMALSENPNISKRINELGSLANAWTSYYGTNYNLFGSINPIENLKLLLDIFYNTMNSENRMQHDMKL